MTTAITTSGSYTIPAADYHADPCPEPSLSNSIGKFLLNQSPAHAHAAHPRLGDITSVEPNRSMTLGAVAHSVILERSWDPIVIVDAPNFTTKAAREERDAAYAAGKLPLLEKDKGTVEDMVLAMENAMKWPSVEEGALYEQTLCWQEGASWNRARVDCIDTGGEDEDTVILYDLKTTAINATAQGWGRTVIWDHVLQAAWYLRGYEALTGQGASFIFVVQETKAPYAVRPFQFDSAGAAYGAQLADRAAALWAQCMESGEWPSYPPDIMTVETPEWVTRRIEDW